MIYRDKTQKWPNWPEWPKITYLLTFYSNLDIEYYWCLNRTRNWTVYKHEQDPKLPPFCRSWTRNIYLFSEKLLLQELNPKRKVIQYHIQMVRLSSYGLFVPLTRLIKHSISIRCLYNIEYNFSELFLLQHFKDKLKRQALQTSRV